MRVVKSWRRVVAFSLSFWLQFVGLLVLIVPEIVFIQTGIDSDPVLLWWIGALLLVAGLAGRLFNQGNNPIVEWLRIGAVLIVIGLLAVFASSAQANDCKDESLDIAVPLIGRWEGLRLNAYLDIVNVPTICYGSTRGVEMGMRKTRDECENLLREEVEEYMDGWLWYVKSDVFGYWLPPTRVAAYTSLAYNVGIRGAGRSTATRRLNSGNIRGGCKALTWFNRAGQRVIRGLVRRRADEYEYCMIGVKPS